MLKLANSKENIETVKKGTFLWRSPEGLNFYDTKQGIIMAGPHDMCVVTPQEFAMMKNIERFPVSRETLHG